MPPAVGAGGQATLVKDAAAEAVWVLAVGSAQRDLFSVGIMISSERRAVGAHHVVGAGWIVASPGRIECLFGKARTAMQS